jgi:hypothetical protein
MMTNPVKVSEESGTRKLRTSSGLNMRKNTPLPSIAPSSLRSSARERMSRRATQNGSEGERERERGEEHVLGEWRLRWHEAGKIKQVVSAVGTQVSLDVARSDDGCTLLAHEMLAQVEVLAEHVHEVIHHVVPNFDRSSGIVGPCCAQHI